MKDALSFCCFISIELALYYIYFHYIGGGERLLNFSIAFQIEKTSRTTYINPIHSEVLMNCEYASVHFDSNRDCDVSICHLQIPYKNIPMRGEDEDNPITCSIMLNFFFHIHMDKEVFL